MKSCSEKMVESGFCLVNSVNESVKKARQWHDQSLWHFACVHECECFGFACGYFSKWHTHTISWMWPGPEAFLSLTPSHELDANTLDEWWEVFSPPKLVATSVWNTWFSMRGICCLWMEQLEQISWLCPKRTVGDDERPIHSPRWQLWPPDCICRFGAIAFINEIMLNFFSLVGVTRHDYSCAWLLLHPS